MSYFNSPKLKRKVWPFVSHFLQQCGSVAYVLDILFTVSYFLQKCDSVSYSIHKCHSFLQKRFFSPMKRELFPPRQWLTYFLWVIFSDGKTLICFLQKWVTSSKSVTLWVIFSNRMTLWVNTYKHISVNPSKLTSPKVWISWESLYFPHSVTRCKLFWIFSQLFPQKCGVFFPKIWVCKI